MITIYETATYVILEGPDTEITLLVDAFKFRPENYFFALSYQRYKVSNKVEGWDGYIYPVFKVYKNKAKALRGYKQDIIKTAKLYNISLDLSKLLEYPLAHLEIDDVRPDLIAGTYTLDLNQRQCILEWVKAGIGFNKITVGGGKTATFAGAAALIKENFPQARFLYITPSERLVKQTTQEMRRFLPHFDIGQCGGGLREFDAADMVVCTVAMLNKNFQTLLKQKWFDTFMAILYDEVHHCGSKTSKKILMAIPAYFRLGASDTAKENDKLRAHAIKGLFGPLLNEVDAAPLIEIGRLAKPTIYVVDCPEWTGRFQGIQYTAAKNSPAFVLLNGQWVKGKYKGPVYELDEKGEPKYKLVKTAEKDLTGNWIYEKRFIIVSGVHNIEINGQIYQIESRWCLLERVYDRAIVQFKSRNDLILEWVKHFHAKQWSTVVVATRTTHVYILESLIKNVIPQKQVNILIGDDSPNTRNKIFDWFRNTPGSVLITPLVKEGVSINEIRAMIVADHVSDYEVARQIIGRAMRPKKDGDNEARIVWFWDRQHPILDRSCAELFTQLEKSTRFKFIYNCRTPDSVSESSVVFCSNKHEKRRQFSTLLFPTPGLGSGG